MNKLYLLFTLLFGFSSAFAQITYEAADYIQPTDTLLFSNANLLVNSYDFSTAGADVNWDFSDLRVSDQNSDIYLPAISTGYSAFYCLNNGIFFGCDSEFSKVATIGVRGGQSFDLPGFEIGLKDVTRHYLVTEEGVTETLLGVTPDLQGLSIALGFPFQDPFEQLHFPLTYQRTDNSTGRLAIDLSSFGFEVQVSLNAQLSSEVDGFGSLTTPFGTFEETLRLRTEVINNDTIVTDTATQTIRREEVIYQWFSKDYGVPVLTVTASKIADTEIVTNIRFVDRERCGTVPISLFSYSPLLPTLSATEKTATVDFTSQSINADSVQWIFEDGTTSTESDFTYIFNCPGTQQVTLIAYNTACDTVISNSLTLPIIINGPSINPAVTVEGSSLFAAELNADSYQWLDCNAGDTEIDGATDRIFTPETNGNYAVRMKLGNCEVTSDCAELVISNTLDLAEEFGLQLAPNPASDRLIVRTEDGTLMQELQIFDLLGKQVLQKQFAPSTQLEIDLAVPTGIYLVKVTDTKKQTATKRVVKE